MLSTRIQSVTFVLIAYFCASAFASAQSVRFSTTYAANVPLKVITVNLSDTNVKITGAVTKYGSGHAEPFGQMVSRAAPTVAVTGTFFCPYSRSPIGDIVIDGQLAHFGGLGTALCITDNNEIEFVKPEMNTHHDWSKYDFVICSGPRLVTDGIAYVEPWTEGFHDKHMLNRNGRLAIGVTGTNQLVIVATRCPVYLSRLAKAMKALGVRDAINLDAGSSMGLHYKGKTLIQPARWLTNLIVVYENKARYEERKDKLLPVTFRSARK